MFYKILETLKKTTISLYKRKSYSLTVIFSLGVTLGGLLASVNLNYLLFVEPLPYPDQEKLFISEQVFYDNNFIEQFRSLSYPALIHLYKNQSVFSKVTMIDYQPNVITSHPEQPMVMLSYTTSEYSELFSVPMEVGRFFQKSDVVNQLPVVVISYDTWQRFFNLRTDILKQKLTLIGNNLSYKIVGVIKKEFVEPQLIKSGRNTQAWLPWSNAVLKYWGWSSTTDTIFLAGKLKKDRNISQAQQLLTEGIRSRWQEEVVGSSSSYQGWSTRVKLSNLKKVIIGENKKNGLMVLAGMIGLVVIACANITNLFISRIAEYQRTFAIHAALGAKKMDLSKLFFGEVAMLMFLSILFALIIAWLGLNFTQHYLFDIFPRVKELSINLVTLYTAIILAMLLSIIFTTLAVNVINYRKLNLLLNSSGKGGGLQIPKIIINALTAVQVSIAAFIILISMTLFKEAVDTVYESRGFSTQELSSTYLNYLNFGKVKVEEMKVAAIEVRDRLRELPIVEAVSQSHSPLQDFIETSVISRVNNKRYFVSLKRIDHHYLTITRQKLLTGRNFSQSDIKDSNDVMLVNKAFANQLEIEGGVIGLLMYRGGGEPYKVIGIVDDIHFYDSPIDTPRIYLPASEAGFNFVIKYKTGKNLSREELSSIIQTVSPQVSIFLYDSLEELHFKKLSSKILMAITTALLTFIVIILAGVGLYGIINYSTQLRRFELGIRIAIGAKPKQLVALIIKDNVVAVLWGMVMAGIFTLLTILYFIGFIKLNLNEGFLIIAIQTVMLIFLIVVAASYFSLRKYILKPAIHSLKTDRAN